MTWVRLDDCFPDHRKVEGLSDGAFRVIVSALCYANRNETDGSLNARDLAKIGATKKRVDELLAAGLFERDASGIRIHDYHDYQPSKAKRQADREATRERVAEHRAAKRNAKGNSVTRGPDPGGGNAVTTGVSNGGCNTAPSRPDQILPADAAAKDLSGSAPEVPPERQRRRPANLAEALKLEPQERAQALADDPHLADWLEPGKWPEVAFVAQVFGEATGQGPVRLGAYGRDSGLRAIVGLYAAGHTRDELGRVVRNVVKSKFWKDGKRGLSSLTPEVVRIALSDPPGAETPTAEQELAELYVGQ